jgi:release factor glutamine methyltransferase
MLVREALKHAISQLRAANVPSFTLAAELLLLHALGRDRTWLYAHPDDVLNEAARERLESYVSRRILREPTQHITGKQEFWGLGFEVTPEVLIPRPETEHVVEMLLDRLAVREVRAGRLQKNSGAGLRIADLGTGSGCIAIALAHELPQAAITALDISPAALAVARRNAGRHGAQRIEFVESDLFAGFEKSSAPRLFDVIVSNPPYIGRREMQELAPEVRDREPALALIGGEEGYEFYAGLIAESARHLAPEGLLVLELGHDSLAAVRPLVEPPDWVDVSVTSDLAGIPRVLAAQRART